MEIVRERRQWLLRNDHRGVRTGAGEGNRTLVFSLEGGKIHNENKVISSKTVDICPKSDQGVTIGSQNLVNAFYEFSTIEATSIYDAINDAHTVDQLDELARTLWRGYGLGKISDADAEALQACVNRRRPLARNTPRTAPGRNVGLLAARIASRFVPRQHPRSPDRKASRERRRVLGGSAVMPPNLRHHYTEGQRAVLAIVAGEIKHHGTCDLPIDKIAALAGVCRTTVQNALHEARRLLHLKITERPQPGRKSLTNVIEIIAPEWSTWIKRGPTAYRPIGSKPVKMVSPTKITEVNKKGLGNDLRAQRWRSAPQPSSERVPPAMDNAGRQSA